MMDLKAEILKEHSKAHALKIAEYATASPDHFKELMECFMSNEYRLAQRAAWSVSWAAGKDPTMVMPYIGELVAALEMTGVHDAVIRNSLRVLEKIEIPETFHGEVMNACFTFIENPKAPVAFKAFSLAILGKLANTYPEIKQDLKLIIEANWDSETPAFRSRGKKILKNM